MKMLHQNEYEEIRSWMHRNAREVDLAVWNYMFEGGKKEEIIKALAYYQREDGGFGNVFEPDCWNQESSPYTTLTAAGLLRKIGFPEEAGGNHPMMKGIFRYLEGGAYSDEDGWFFSIPSNSECPRAPWWTYDEETNRVQGMGVTAGLCAFILRYAERDSAVFQKAAGYAGNILQKAPGVREFGEMGAAGVCMLLGDIMQAGLDSELPYDGALMEKMAEAVNSSIERSPEKWAQYTKRPSEFIESPESPFYHGNEELVERELDYLIDTRNPGGVWNITWNWFDLGERYPKEFAVSENWWMAVKAIEKLDFLQKFGRTVK